MDPSLFWRIFMCVANSGFVIKTIMRFYVVYSYSCFDYENHLAIATRIDGNFRSSVLEFFWLIYLFGLLLEPFGDWYLALATLMFIFWSFQKFGYFLLKLSGSTDLNDYLLTFRAAQNCWNFYFLEWQPCTIPL